MSLTRGAGSTCQEFCWQTGQTGYSIHKVLKAIQVVQRQLALILRLQQAQQRLLQGPQLPSVSYCLLLACQLLLQI